MHGPQQPASGALDIIDCRTVISAGYDFAGVAICVLNRFGRDAELAQDPARADRGFGQNRQRMVVSISAHSSNWRRSNHRQAGRWIAG